MPGRDEIAAAVDERSVVKRDRSVVVAFGFIGAAPMLLSIEVLGPALVIAGVACHRDTPPGPRTSSAKDPLFTPELATEETPEEGSAVVCDG